MKRVLFLCTGNSARSQMAEGFASHLGKGTAEFFSAGTWPSREVNTFAVAVMLEKGIDITGNVPKTFTSIPRPISLIVAVCGQAASECPAPGPEFDVQLWDLTDPAAFEGSDEDTMAVFRESRDEVEVRVRELLRALN